MSTGRKDSTGPAWPRLSSRSPQPYWKMATMTPKEAPAASRFITAATAGIRRLRKARSSSRNRCPKQQEERVSTSVSLLIEGCRRALAQVVEEFGGGLPQFALDSL